MTEPKLQKPGAGLPFFENLFIRYWILPRAKRQMNWNQVDAMFEREAQRTLALVKTITGAQRQQRVLIPRIRGIENSSRYWSIDMTLEHMMIVAKGMAFIIDHLAQEKPFPHLVGTADVKPHEIVSDTVMDDFSQSMTDIAAFFKSIQNRASKMTHSHPWFGKMNTGDWHRIIAMHQRLHRYQIEQIILNLGKKS